MFSGRDMLVSQDLDLPCSPPGSEARPFILATRHPHPATSRLHCGCQAG